MARLHSMQSAAFSSMAFNKNVDYYSQLGVTQTATQEEIKHKFYELAKKHHPDSCESKPDDEEMFKKITAAYDVLSSAKLKMQYDAARRSNNGNDTENKTYQGGFNHNYKARESRTYTYRAG